MEDMFIKERIESCQKKVLFNIRDIKVDLKVCDI